MSVNIVMISSSVLPNQWSRKGAVLRGIELDKNRDE
jgi:hypothetical protein